MILRPYQRVGRDFLASRRFALLADEMRVGKTPQAILAAREVKARNTLVICPAIAVDHWHAEWGKWKGEGFMRAFSYERAAKIESVLKSQQHDILIVDEAHFAKNPEARRTRLIYGRHGLGWYAQRVWALSGTPASKHAGELWPMLCAFGVTKMGYEDFCGRYCYYDKLGRIRGTKAAMIPELKALLASVMLRRTRKDVAPEMPGIDYQFLEVPREGTDLPDPQVPERELPAWLERQSGSPGLAEARIAVASAKAPALADNILFSLTNGLLKQTVVFGWHNLPLETLRLTLEAAGVKLDVLNGSTSPKRRVEIQEDFRHGKLQVVLANIKAAGTAIDLSAASHGYFLEMAWVPSDNTQAANRLVSMQKAEPVTIDIATMPGTIDDAVQRTLLRRVKEISQLY